MNATSKCLLTKHHTSTVADLLTTSACLRGTHQGPPHTPLPQCVCLDCTNDRQYGCHNPHACALEALTQINLITSKLNPLPIGDQHDNLSLTKRCKARNQAAAQTNGTILFDPSITCKDNLAECFRIFVDPNKLSNIPARRYYTNGINLRHQEVTVYTDGASFNNGKQNARCGSGIWFGPDDRRNASL
jgi:hypothetical protein